MDPAPALVTVKGAPSGAARRVAWRSETTPAPRTARVAGDVLSADAALHRLRSGEAIVWSGDWHGARQLLAAVGRRLRTRPRAVDLAALFRAEREAKRRERATLSLLAIPVGPGWRSPLRRAPSLEAPLSEAFGAPPEEAVLMPMREVLGAIGAHEWFRRGVPVPALGGRVHPRYGVFAPVRGEYVDLVAGALATRAGELGLAGGARAFDVGTGTGVLAILLARAGARVVASDIDARAVACARENAARFGVADRVEVVRADLFPPGRARLVVANPPWIPEEPQGALDRAVYDPGGALLARLVAGLPEHLEPGGQAWVVLSDLAERLGLRPPGTLESLARSAGLDVAFTSEIRPSHPRARDPDDPLAAARSGETTRLYGLVSLATSCRHATA